MTELVIKTKRFVPFIDWFGVPSRFVGKVSAVCRTLAECQELVKWFGDPTFCPMQPILVHAPNGWVIIPGFGYAPASELADCAVVAWHQQPKDFDSLRERNGLMRREDVDAATRDALERRVAAHKPSPVTAPPRQPIYPNPTDRTLHSVPDSQEWKVQI